jgi:hypothetical protein
MSWFSSKGPNMSILEKFYINKNERTNEILNGLYINCKKNDKGITELTGPINYGNVKLDQVKERMKQNIDKINFIKINSIIFNIKKIKEYKSKYKGKYFIDTNIGKNKKPILTFIDKPLNDILIEKDSLVFVFDKTKIKLNNEKDTIYVIIDQKIEIEERYRPINDFFISKDVDKKLNGLYFNFVNLDNKNLKFFSMGYKIDDKGNFEDFYIKGDIVDMPNKNLNEYIEAIKQNYKQELDEYQNFHESCNGFKNLNFLEGAEAFKFRFEPNQSKIKRFCFQNHIKTKRKLDKENLKFLRDRTNLEKNNFIKVEKLEDINNKNKFNAYKGKYPNNYLIKEKIYHTGKKSYSYIKNLEYSKKLNEKKNRLYTYNYYLILEPNNNSTKKVNNIKQNVKVNASTNGQGNAPTNVKVNAPTNVKVNAPTNGQGNANKTGPGNASTNGQGNANKTGPGNASTNGQGNAPTNGQGNAPTNGQGNASTNGQGNANKTGPGNASTNGQGNASTNGQGNANKTGPGNAPTNGQGNANKTGPGNASTNGQGNAPTNVKVKSGTNGNSSQEQIVQNNKKSVYTGRDYLD